MTIGLDDLGRRLVDLAESGGPWDDPLPEIRRRAAAISTDSVSTGSTVFRSPTVVRRPRRWLHSVDITLVVAASVVVALVAGVGWLIHTGGPSSEKSSSAAGVQSSSAAGTTAGAGATASSRAAEGQSAPGSTSTAACGFPAPTSAVTLRAPARVRTGTSVSVGVRLTGRAAADLYSPLVVAVQNGRVVGRLVPKFIPPGPSLRPSSPTATSTTVTGTLRRSTCAQAIAQAHGPQVHGPQGPQGLALPPGRYQLIAVATASGARVVSAPVTVIVIR